MDDEYSPQSRDSLGGIRPLRWKASMNRCIKKGIPEERGFLFYTEKCGT